MERAEGAVPLFTEKDVVHDASRQLFHLDLTPGKKTRKQFGVLEYNRVISEDSAEKRVVYDLYHTEVPPQFRGRGIAKIVTKAAFDTLLTTEDKAAQLLLTCTYVQRFYREHKDEYKHCDIKLPK